MKQVLFLIFSFLLSATWATAQEYSNSVALVSQSDNLLVVDSKAVGDRKRDAQEMALKSAFHCLFYKGVAGYNGGKPLLQKDNAYYSERFFSERYAMFVGNSTVIGDIGKTVDKKRYACTMRVEILIGSLVRDLVTEGLASKPASETSMEETDEAIVLPSIMVVPYKTENETYRSVIQKNSDKRSAMVKVQEMFVQYGVTTIDLEGQLDAVYTSKEFNLSTARSAEKNVITRSGADVYVTVDVQQQGTSEMGKRVKVDMKAYDTKSGSILSTTTTGWTNPIKNVDVGDLCIMAVKTRMSDFMRALSTSFAKQMQGGKTISLRIFKSKAGKWSLDSQVGDAGYTLSSVIRRWVKKHAEKGRIHIKGGVNELLWFDTIAIPSTDEDGMSMDAATWGDSLLYYLNQELRVACKMKFDGTAIDITLQ